MGMIVSPYMTAPATGGMPVGAVAMWKGEGNLNDEGGLYNASNNGSGLTYVTGKDGQAIQYGGSGYAEIAAINVGADFSLSFWLRVNGTVGPSGAGIIGAAHNVANRFGVIYSNPGYSNASGANIFNYYQNSASRIAGFSLCRRDVWYKHTIVKTGGVMSWYINNLLYGTTNVTQDWNQITRFLSAVSGWGAISASIDEVTLFNTAISPPSLTGNLYSSFDGSGLIDLASGWDAYAAGSESYADGADATPNHAWNHTNSANDVRTLHRMNLGSNWTIEFDIYPDTGTGADGAVLQGGGSSECILFQGGSNNRIIYRDNSTNHVITTTNSVPQNTWTHVKLTYDNNKVRAYINSGLNATESSTHSVTWESRWSGPPTTGGSPFGGTRFMGRIDNLKFYNAVV